MQRQVSGLVLLVLFVGSFYRTVAALAQATPPAVASIYVADDQSGRVDVFDSSGARIRSFTLLPVVQQR
jgi:hypothetical protein